jgi:transposase
LLALAVIYEGGSRTDAARVGAVGLQTVRDWVLRFNAEGPEGLLTGKAPGACPLLSPEQRQALERIIDEGPIPAVHGVVRWRLIDLVQWVWDEFRISISPQTLSRELRSLDYRKLSARPRHHEKSEAQVTAFKKPSRLAWRRSRPVRPGASR